MQSWTIKSVKMYLYNKYPSGKRLILSGDIDNERNFFEISPLKSVRVNRILLGKTNEKAFYSTFKIEKVRKEFESLLRNEDIFYSRHYAFTMKCELSDNTSGKSKKLMVRCDDVDIDEYEYNGNIMRIVGSCSDCKFIKK